jgi:hypothetical protein
MNANTPKKMHKAGDVRLYIEKIAAINCTMRPVSFTDELLEITSEKLRGCIEENEPFENMFVNSEECKWDLTRCAGLLGNFILPHGIQT